MDHPDWSAHDLDMLGFFYPCFDRAAFQFPFLLEVPTAMIHALDETILALSTGVRQTSTGITIARGPAKSDFEDPDLRAAFDHVVADLHAVKKIYELAVAAGQLDVRAGVVIARDPGIPAEIDRTRNQALRIINAVYRQIGRPTFPLIPAGDDARIPDAKWALFHEMRQRFEAEARAAPPTHAPPTAASERMPILFVAAEPTDTARLRLGQELRDIQERLQVAHLRDRFVLHQRLAVRPVDLSQALLDVQPRIVHFSGHGAASGAVYLENPVGRMQPVAPAALAALFEQFATQVRGVVLNACYSEVQARAIAHHIRYVIGMHQDIGDDAAIAFAVGFYQALGAGRDIEAAYQLGCVQIRLQGLDEHLTPVLIKAGS